MKKIKLTVWLAYLFLVVVAACQDDDNPQPYTVTVTADADHGTAMADPATCLAGESVTLTATANEGFDFVKWRLVGGNMTLSDSTSNPLSIIMPASNVALEALFAEQTVLYPINLSAQDYGSVRALNDGNELTAAAEDVIVILSAIPEDGYEFAGWTLEGVEVDEDGLLINPLSIVMPAGEISVEASFVEIVNVLDELTDPTFKAYVQESMQVRRTFTLGGITYDQPAWDSNADGIFSKMEAAAVKYINLHEGYTSAPDEYGDSDYSGEGIEIFSSDLQFFTGLVILDLGLENYCSDGIDLSACKKLEYLDLSEVDLYDLPVKLGEKPVLKTLNLSYCDVTNIDLDGCTALETCFIQYEGEKLSFVNAPQLKILEATGWYAELDVTKNTELTRLVVRKNDELTDLDISNNKKLTYLDASGTAVVEVDITQMAFESDNIYTAYVGENTDDKTVTLKMRSDQKAHWEANLKDHDKNTNVEISVE